MKTHKVGEVWISTLGYKAVIDKVYPDTYSCYISFYFPNGSFSHTNKTYIHDSIFWKPYIRKPVKIKIGDLC